jgi:proteasome lid subunit RPN8/RPN11
VSLDGNYKTLNDCTLAELQDFADQMEADIWQTYREIKLAELAKDSSVKMAMDVVDAAGEPVAPSREWLAKMVVETAVAAQIDEEPDEPLSESITDEPVTAEADTPEETNPKPESEEPAQESDPEPELAPVEPADTKPADDIDNIIVSEPELVHEEREAEPDLAQGSTVIAPSQARVRLAGRYLPIGDPTPAAVDITIEEPALRASQAHALSSLNREVAGVLIGPRPEKQPDGRYRVHILDTIIAKHTVMHGASVTYTPESWRYMRDKLNERYPDETAVIVGWYHTHPGFGIFLSGMDLFIHQNFFTQIWHVAFVLDPRAQTSGFFSWNREKSQVSRHNFSWPEWAAGSW